MSWAMNHWKAGDQVDVHPILMHAPAASDMEERPSPHVDFAQLPPADGPGIEFSGRRRFGGLAPVQQPAG